MQVRSAVLLGVWAALIVENALTEEPNPELAHSCFTHSHTCGVASSRFILKDDASAEKYIDANREMPYMFSADGEKEMRQNTESENTWHRAHMALRPRKSLKLIIVREITRVKFSDFLRERDSNS